MEMETTILFSLLISSSLFLLFYLSSFFHPKHSTTTPTPSTHPIIGNLIAFLHNRHRFFDWATQMLSDSPSNTINVRGPLFTSRGICTADPTNVDHLLKSNFSNYIKGDRFHSVLSELLGHGIFNVDGQLWSSQRKIASHEFNTRSLKSFVADTVRSETINRLLPTLISASNTNQIIDLQDIFRKFSFDNICNLAFGDDPACLDPSNSDTQPLFVQAFDEAVEICSARFMAPTPWVWKFKKLLRIGSERKLKQLIGIIDNYAMKIIESKKIKNKNDPDRDLLSRFMSTNQDSNLQDPIEKCKFLRDIIISFILAGKDSTSTALTWFFWLLSTNPKCEKRAYAEISEAMVEAQRRDGEILEYEELKSLNYLHAAITESLRLYPPVPIDSRVAVADDVMPDGTRVGAGWFADYSAYAMGRMERLWGKECLEFKPERWLDEYGTFVGVDQFRFPVFHGGPRVCLGKEMAYVQMKSVAAAVIYGFEVVGVREEMPTYVMSLTLKMDGGFPVRVSRRKY
ncbi:cytochrome P450 94A1-like [Magnolia sinica]|uniref:cytochrome P450 94A1-like n=1 Tax=Magnolia sinica TaxID=86752 RepID=UPI00265B3EA6|nr:cytochrome P450 94A1-like [Magnolia sinica]